MKVVFQYQGLLTDSYKRAVRDSLPREVEVVFIDRRDDDLFLREMEDADILVGYKLTPELMERARRLRHIQIPWTGFDNLGVEYLRPGITVSNSHANSLAIAEHAVSLLLAAAKLLVMRDMGMRKGDWTSRYEEVNSVWLTGKKLLVVGYGAIGRKVARILRDGFGMEVTAVRRHGGDADGVASEIHDPSSLLEDVRVADFIVVAVPLTKETRGLINSGHFARMKRTAVLVNIARGPVVDERSLYEALRDREIHSAGIDVWYNYPRGDQRTVFQNYPFEELDNIVMTPHSAFKVMERERVFIGDIVENINRIYRGEDPINQVNLELGY